MEIAAAILLGFAGGAVGGLLGVGGGVLFVPALAVFLDETHLVALSTSLMAIVLPALVGAWRQRRFGNLRLADGLWIPALSAPGIAAGVVAANAVPERVLELAFAALLLAIAARMARRGLARPRAGAQR